MSTELYIGSGPNLLYPGLTEVIRLTSKIHTDIDLNSELHITLESEINIVLELRGRVYG